jgi:diketogulonate reductase-like aldo/keto reductase
VRYILEQPTVAGTMIGSRLGISEHLAENARVFEFSLDAEDYQKIQAVTEKSQDLFRTIGDCGDEYRR